MKLNERKRVDSGRPEEGASLLVYAGKEQSGWWPTWLQMAGIVSWAHQKANGALIGSSESKRPIINETVVITHRVSTPSLAPPAVKVLNVRIVDRVRKNKLLNNERCERTKTQMHTHAHTHNKEIEGLCDATSNGLQMFVRVCVCAMH